MKNKVLKTIGYIVGITWLFTACALDDEVYGMTEYSLFQSVRTWMTTLSDSLLLFRLRCAWVTS